MNGSSALRRVAGRLAVALGLIVLGAGCAGRASAKAAHQNPPPVTASDVEALRDVDLRLVTLRVDGQSLDAAAFPTTLRFGKGQTVGGRAPVNRYFGSYELGADGAITWPGAGFRTTRMAGPELALRREAEFLRALSSTHKATLPPEGIRFESGDGRTMLEFRK